MSSSSTVSQYLDLIEDSKKRIELFRKAWTCRYIDEKTKKLAKQNKGGTFHISTNGHELLGALCAMHLTPGKDWGLPYYRDRGFAVGFDANIDELLTAFLARDTKNHSGGRMMPEHFCDRNLRIPCQSSVVGSQLLHAVGIAHSTRMMGKDEVVYVSIGDGGTSQGDFHEALNFSSIHKLGVIFVVQDNGWAISVPQKEQTSGGSVAQMASGYADMQIHQIDGTNCSEIAEAMAQSVERGREGRGPSLIVAKVPRLSPHSSSDDHLKYKTQEQIDADQKRDPLVAYTNYLIAQGIDNGILEEIKEEAFAAVEHSAKVADQAALPDSSDLESKVYAPFKVEDNVVASSSGEQVVMVDAINHALIETMQNDSSIVVFGQDVAHGKGGVFRATNQLSDLFGTRVFNTPLAESTIIGIATGMSMAYHRPVAEVQFADYLWTGMNQLINELASIYFRSNGQQSCSVVVRMPCGGYIQGGPYHSQNIEGFLAHQPGLKIVYPSNAEDAKRLLKAAIADPNPVVFLEHKGLYRQRLFAARVEPGSSEIESLGKAKLVQKGDDLTIVTWGMMTAYCHEIVERNKLSCDVIDLRTISPWDRETVLESVEKTGKLLVVQEAQRTGGFAGEVVAEIAELAFEYLDAPIRRVCGLDTPVAYAKDLEEKILPNPKKIEQAIVDLLRY